VLQDKLARREAELSQVKGDLDLMGKEGPSGEAVTELKQRLLDVSKKHRRLQVNSESQKSRIQQLESELKKPREEARKQAEEIAAQTYGAMLGDGSEDWKKKYLQASNKLQEARQEAHELKTEMHRHKKVLIKELGPDEPLEKVLATADDPGAAGWKGRAAQIAQLQRHLREMKEQVKRVGEPSEADTEKAVPRRSAAAAEKDRAAVDKAAEKRREEFDRLQEEVEKLRSDQADAKRKREGLKSRNAVLEGQLKELKAHVTTLVQKSENDDELVSALRRQLGRHGPSMQLDDISEETENLRQENEELQAQLERQAQIVLQLKQKSLAATCDAGSVRLGPRSLDPQTPTGALSERVRFLEAENAKHVEHVKLLQHQLGEDAGPGRPFSAESSMNLKERLRQLSDKLATSERENQTLRHRVEEQRPSSSASGRSSSAGPRSMGPDMEQLLRQNEALKREVAGLMRVGGSTPKRVGSPCSSLGGDR
jgi:chromosome segregation ATPase